jgi:Chloroplast envelope transporter
MNSNLYQVKPLAQRSFFQKLLKQHPEENAVTELNNLLATKAISAITEADISAIEKNYDISLIKEFKLNLEEFYAVYLNHCLADKVLSEQEMTDLLHLKYLLSLDDKTVEKLHAMLGEVIYRQSFEAAVADGRLTHAENEFLNRLEVTLRLPKALADKISAETRMNFIGNYVSGVIADQRLSPAEEQEMNAIAASLNVNVQLSTQTQEQLRKLKLYWAIENLQLPVVHTDIHLQKNEVCHFAQTNVKWFERRKVSTRTTTLGYRYSLKVAKGFYLRSGTSYVNANSTEVLKEVNSGNLYLTNKRIVFVGVTKNSTIRLERLVQFTPYTDGVELDKDSGKSPVLQLRADADLFCMILGRLLDEMQ